MKRYRLNHHSSDTRETLKERWERALQSRRVDAKGLEPIRLRVRLLQEQRRSHRHPPQ